MKSRVRETKSHLLHWIIFIVKAHKHTHTKTDKKWAFYMRQPSENSSCGWLLFSLLFPSKKLKKDHVEKAYEQCELNIGHRTQWSLSSPSLLLLVSFQNIDTSLLNILRTNDLNNCQPTKRSKVNYITVKKKTKPLLSLHQFFSSSLHLVCAVVIFLLYGVIDKRSVLKEPVDAGNTWSSTHLFVIENNKNGKVFVTWNISHGPIIFLEVNKIKMHAEVNELNEK